MEVRQDTHDRFVERVQTRLSGSVWQGCNSWYVDENGRNFTIWPHFTWKYWLETRKLKRHEYDVVHAATASTAEPARERQPA